MKSYRKCNKLPNLVTLSISLKMPKLLLRCVGVGDGIVVHVANVVENGHLDDAAKYLEKKLLFFNEK